MPATGEGGGDPRGESDAADEPAETILGLLRCGSVREGGAGDFLWNVPFLFLLGLLLPPWAAPGSGGGSVVPSAVAWARSSMSATSDASSWSVRSSSPPPSNENSNESNVGASPSRVGPPGSLSPPPPSGSSSAVGKASFVTTRETVEGCCFCNAAAAWAVRTAASVAASDRER